MELQCLPKVSEGWRDLVGRSLVDTSSFPERAFTALTNSSTGQISAALQDEGVGAGVGCRGQYSESCKAGHGQRDGITVLGRKEVSEFPPGFF